MLSMPGTIVIIHKSSIFLISSNGRPFTTISFITILKIVSFFLENMLLCAQKQRIKKQYASKGK